MLRNSTSRVLDRWAYGNGVDLKLIVANKPKQNALIENFNGKFRDVALKGADQFRFAKSLLT